MKMKYCYGSISIKFSKYDLIMTSIDVYQKYSIHFLDDDDSKPPPNTVHHNQKNENQQKR